MTTLNELDTVVGLDPSLSATGLATRQGLYTVKTKPTDGDMIDRGMSVGYLVADLIPAGTTLLVIERPIVYARGGTSSQLHQGIGAMRTILRQRLDIPTYLVSPSTIKKAATGSGRATKKQMLAAARAAGAPAKNDNEADAYWLARYALDTPPESETP